MPYATRPMGDYKTYGYAGDPGWLSSLWKKVVKPVIGGLIGGPIGAVIGGVVGGASQAPAVATPPALAPPPGSIGGAVTFPGGARVSIAGVLPTHAGLLPGHTPAGFHLDKKTRTRWVRNRRMNVANPRALRKAMRRVQGFEKLAKRTIQFTRRVRIKK
ncbi:MAG: hypothetical protein V3S55_15740 [Nitrospiraceae bacterium]